jgi:hypothetical protein
MVEQMMSHCDDLREENKNLSLHVDGTQEGLEMPLKEFMETVAGKLEEMEEKICKVHQKVNHK